MSAPFSPRDVIAGVGISLWMLGMGLVLGHDDAALRAAGAVLWAGGLATAVGVAARVYLGRDPYAE